MTTKANLNNGGTGAGRLLSLVLNGTARSRTELAQAMGLSRATISQRLDPLLQIGLLQEAEKPIPSGGRLARAVELNPAFAMILVADIGESHARVAATDLGTKILAEDSGAFDMKSGPKAVLTWLCDRFDLLLSQIGRPIEDVLGIGLSLPAPVDYIAGRIVGPSIMIGWDGFDIRGFLAKRFAIPVVADNDVNIMTLAEHRRHWPKIDQMFFVKAGTGIGSGIITSGKIYRGAQGAAGDIGHICLGGHGDPLCRCGNIGCVESIAGGWAIARDLRAQGFEANDGRDVLSLVQRNVPEAIRRVREAGRVLGEVIADSVSILNPSVVVVGGSLARAEEYLLTGVRELVYQRSLPLATRELVITTSSLDERAGVLGAAQLVLDTHFLPEVIEGTVANILASR